MSDKELSKDVLKDSSSAEINAEPVEEKTAVSVVKICGMTEAQVRTGVSGMSFKDSVDHEFESEDCGEVHIRLTGPKKAVKSAVKEIKAAFGINVFTSHEEKICTVIVPNNQLSLAIGNKGQNAKLAAKLTGFKIDIKPQFDTLTGDEAPELSPDFKAPEPLASTASDDEEPEMADEITSFDEQPAETADNDTAENTEE